MSRIARLAALAGLLLALPAAAETYRMDLIVFLDIYGSGSEAGEPAATPELQGAIDPDDVGRLHAAGINVLPDAQFALTQEWQRLRNSKQFKPLLRLAWTQQNPPGERGPALRIAYGKPQVVNDEQTLGAWSLREVEGSVALLLGRYLHLDADLLYNESGRSWRLHERRRMRRDEVHHLDSPRLGILARVTKAEALPEP